MLARDAALAETMDPGAMMEAGRFEDAMDAAARALARDAAQPLPWLVLARACQALSRFEQAAEAFARLDALWPGRAGVLLAWAQCLAEADRLVEAEALLRRVLARGADAAAHANLGAVLARLERPAEAFPHLRAALAIDPGLVAAHRNLAARLPDSEEGRLHRDAAYRGRAVLVRRAARERRRVLVLATADAGNVPLRHLLSREDDTVVEWYADYAAAADAPAECDVAFNGMGDADFAVPVPEVVRAWLAARGLPLLNAPEAVARTRRDRLPALLAGIEGAVVPGVVRHLAAEGTAAAAVARAGLAFPLLARPFGAHGGAGVRRVACAALLAEGDAYLTAYVNYAGVDGWFRKYRAIFVGGEVFPYHLAIGRDWMVHYWTAGMEADAARRAEEQRFLARPNVAIGEVAWRALGEIGRRLGLDYAGIDFAVLADGRLLVFEANAPMLVHPERAAMFAYRNETVERIRAAFSAMLEGARG
jgi:tetratricopeptide (TPR) repeat protein